ncbi:phosphoenolpyruvate carboxykinase (ATP) [Shigella flexneri]
MSDVHDIVYNPSYDLLYQEELDPSLTGYERGVLTNLGAVAVDTGIFTGRSPKDKSIVRDDTTRDTFWWAAKAKVRRQRTSLSGNLAASGRPGDGQLSGKRLFVVDAFCGEPGYSSFRPFHHRSRLAGAFCQKHVYSPER